MIYKKSRAIFVCIAVTLPLLIPYIFRMFDEFEEDSTRLRLSKNETGMQEIYLGDLIDGPSQEFRIPDGTYTVRASAPSWERKDCISKISLEKQLVGKGYKPQKYYVVDSGIVGRNKLPIKWIVGGTSYFLRISPIVGYCEFSLTLQKID